jgi:hypothetical protein
MEENLPIESKPELSLAKRIFHTLVIVILPLLSFWWSFALNPEWQDGKISSYASLLLGFKAAVYFYPLLAYSVVSYLLWLWWPGLFARNPIVWLGTLSGAILALQYLVILAIGYPFILLVVLGWIILAILARWAHPWLVKKIGKEATTLIWLALIGAGMVWIVRVNQNGGALIFFPIVAILGAGPFFCLALAIQALWLIWKKHRRPSSVAGVAAGGAGWLVLYTGAWWLSWQKMMELYAALPEYPPCYIVTAAAQGHPAFVKSKPVGSGEQTLRVNAQLQYLKAAELALLALAPGIHHIVRAVYDVVGRRLARSIVHPLLADLVYLSLKPAEWIVRLILRLLPGEVENAAQRLYLPK